MTTFAPAVRRDNFLFNSILYADAGNDNRHSRATVAELTALLRPEVVKGKAKKTKTKTSEANEGVKDKPWHFWTAQLLHYGLTSTKDKNAAKVRLLSALNSGKLAVPDWIQRLEGEVKKEWEAENRKLKKAAKEGGVSKLGTPKNTAATTKNAAAKVSSSVNKEDTAEKIKKIPMKKTSGITSAASVTSTSTTTKRKRDETEQASPLESSKKAKAKSTTEKMVPSPNPTKATAQTTAVQKHPPPEEEPWPAPQRKVVAHDAWKFFDMDHLAHTRPPNAPHPCPYRISCPDAEREWDSKFIEEFYLAFSATEEEWWSRFKWGAFEGILILQRQPKRVNKAVGVPFKWRAHYAYGNEDGDGDGKIFFDSVSTIRGEFYNFFREKPCQFRGDAIQSARRSVHGQTPHGTPVLDQMRVEWSQMPTTMRDAPAKKPRVKKNKPTDPPSPSAASGTQADIYLSGSYWITSSRMEETFFIPPKNLPLRLTLFTDETTGIWWASFQWASFDGVIKIDPGPTYDTITHVHNLAWRIRHTETGDLTFSRDCVGEIQFDGMERTLKGVLYGVPGVGRVDFEGKRMAGPRRVGGLKRDWDWFVSEAYGRE